MKFSLLVFVVLVSAFAVTQSAYANQENIFPSATGKLDEAAVILPVIDEPNQAAVLITEPATINAKWSNVSEQSQDLKQTANSIYITQEQGCKKINPLEFLENPEAIFKKCQNQTNNQIPQHNSEPIEYLKVPRLDSGISVTVTQF
ncbi:MAG: hypothetical protein KME32_19790 [Mojavia pulchra JT2-VF2]|jgi:hypothetical protein|uniref:Uncharacterized protein n=1 Tax=Mojavia pulchra JT2-VF2 TaxID=287848 RepID=A0A951UHD4_9NOST|nr:hypothetical protein [Mojavia pulchra JT2-VF2]